MYPAHRVEKSIKSKNEVPVIQRLIFYSQGYKALVRYYINKNILEYTLQDDLRSLAKWMCSCPLGTSFDIVLYQTPQKVISLHSDIAGYGYNLTTQSYLQQMASASYHACQKIHSKLKARNCMSNKGLSQNQPRRDWLDTNQRTLQKKTRGYRILSIS